MMRRANSVEIEAHTDVGPRGEGHTVSAQEPSRDIASVPSASGAHAPAEHHGYFGSTQERADLRRLMQLFMPYRHWLAAGITLSIVTLIANIGLMALAGWFIAAMALAGVAGGTLDYFTPAAMIRGFAILRTVGRYLERLVTHEATFRLLAQLRVWFYQRLEPLAPAVLQAHRGGDLVARIQADIDSLNHVYLRVFVPVVAAAVTALGVAVTLACFSLPVALIALALLLCAGLVMPLKLYALGRGPGQRIVALRAALREQVIDDLQGLAELRVYGAQARHLKRADLLSEQLVAAQREMSHLNGWGQAGMIVCATLALWGTLLLAVPHVDHDLSGPDLALLAFLVLASFEAVLPLPQALQMLGETLAAARRIFTLADAVPAVTEPVTPSALPSRHDLQLRGIGLRYDTVQAAADPSASALTGSPLEPAHSSADLPTDRPWALQHFDLDVPAGHRIAIVGASGAGKSTLVNLLLRFREYQTGSARLGGVELRDLDGMALRGRIAVVSQDSYIFNATLRENLLLARPDADDAALAEACRSAQLQDWIDSLPQGYDTELGEAGVRLSGGQARRVAVARALLLDAPILILDEPTEGLDALTERELLATLMRTSHRTGRARSVLLITHRLNALDTIAAQDWLDEVVVLDQGRVVERGTVAHLLAAQGPFKALHDTFLRSAPIDQGGVPARD